MTFKHSFGQPKPATKLTSAVFVFILVAVFGGSAIFREVSRVKPATSEPQPGVVASPVPTRSESAYRVDLLCASLPTPEQFKFIAKSAPTETAQLTSIAYTFRSSRAAEEIYPSFIVWFTQNGWTDNKPAYERLEFSKDNQTVWLSPYHIKEDGDFYTVSCTEWKIEPENISPPIKTPR